MTLAQHLSGSFRRPDFWLYSSWLDVVGRHRRHRLGLLWLFVPTAVYIWGIGGFLGAMQPGLDLPRFYAHIAIGFAVFRLVTTILSDATTTFAASHAYIYDGSLRLTDFLLRATWRTVSIFLLTSPLVAVATVGSPAFQGAGIPLAALGLLIALVNAFAFSVLFALLGARLPDMHEFTGSALLALFLLTPIVWEPEAAPVGTVRGALMRANPLHHVLEAVRDPLLGSTPEPITWAYLGVMTVAGVVLAAWAYGRYARRVPAWL